MSGHEGDSELGRVLRFPPVPNEAQWPSFQEMLTERCHDYSDGQLLEPAANHQNARSYHEMALGVISLELTSRHPEGRPQ
jgi:hypothetical protein